jgi:hypothetical protein
MHLLMNMRLSASSAIRPRVRLRAASVKRSLPARLRPVRAERVIRARPYPRACVERACTPMRQASHGNAVGLRRAPLTRMSVSACAQATSAPYAPRTLGVRVGVGATNMGDAARNDAAWKGEKSAGGDYLSYGASPSMSPMHVQELKLVRPHQSKAVGARTAGVRAGAPGSAYVSGSRNPAGSGCPST